MPLLSVSAHDIDSAGLAIEAELPLAWLKDELADAALEGAAPGGVSVRLSRSGKEVVVRGKVKADLRTPCARCLGPTSIVVDTELSLLLQPKAADASANGRARAKKKDTEEEYEFSSSEADVDIFDGETVVLDPFIREAILLEVPNFPLCSEGCPGIRPAAAAAPEEAGPRIDPRLAPLGALRDKLDKLPAGEPAKTSSKKKKE